MSEGFLLVRLLFVLSWSQLRGIAILITASCVRWIFTGCPFGKTLLPSMACGFVAVVGGIAFTLCKGEAPEAPETHL
jgi:H+/gluconate symporter-like permease